MTIDPQAVRRFADDLAALTGPDDRVGLAVSGGPDSLALLILAAEACPGMVAAATVDHKLRSESADEAAMVAAQCDRLGVPHHILAIEWDERPTANIQALARTERYRLLRHWADGHGLAAVATAHHADDQAETLLMRLARGAGLSGLVGIRADMVRDDGLRLVRPLLAWRKQELVGLCHDAGLTPADDPSNADPHHDRVRMRVWLDGTDIDPARIQTSANALRDADEALQWSLQALVEQRMWNDGPAMMVDPHDLPRELLRRLILVGFERLGAPEPRGPDLMRAIDTLNRGRKASLSGLSMAPGNLWRLIPEPPRQR